MKFQEIRETIEGTSFPISLEETYVCTSPIIKPKCLTFTLTEKLICPYLQKELNLKSYSALMDRSFKVSKPLNVTNKKDELHNALLADIQHDGPFLHMVFQKMTTKQFLN